LFSSPRGKKPCIRVVETEEGRKRGGGKKGTSRIDSERKEKSSVSVRRKNDNRATIRRGGGEGGGKKKGSFRPTVKDGVPYCGGERVRRKRKNRRSGLKGKKTGTRKKSDLISGKEGGFCDEGKKRGKENRNPAVERTREYAASGGGGENLLTRRSGKGKKAFLPPAETKLVGGDRKKWVFPKLTGYGKKKGAPRRKTTTVMKRKKKEIAFV